VRGQKRNLSVSAECPRGNDSHCYLKNRSRERVQEKRKQLKTNLLGAEKLRTIVRDVSSFSLTPVKSERRGTLRERNRKNPATRILSDLNLEVRKRKGRSTPVQCIEGEAKGLREGDSKPRGGKRQSSTTKKGVCESEYWEGGGREECSRMENILFSLSLSDEKSIYQETREERFRKESNGTGKK